MEHTSQQPSPGTGPEEWVAAAIAEQEEYLKRRAGCGGRPFVAHSFATFGRPDPDGTIAGSATWAACTACGVTQTAEDYRVRAVVRGCGPGH